MMKTVQKKKIICSSIVDFWKQKFQKTKYELWQVLIYLCYHLHQGLWSLTLKAIHKICSINKFENLVENWGCISDSTLKNIVVNDLGRNCLCSSVLFIFWGNNICYWDWTIFKLPVYRWMHLVFHFVFYYTVSI